MDEEAVAGFVRPAGRDFERARDHRRKAEAGLRRMQSHRLGKSKIVRMTENCQSAFDAVDFPVQVAPVRPAVVAVFSRLALARQGSSTTRDRRAAEAASYDLVRPAHP